MLGALLLSAASDSQIWYECQQSHNKKVANNSNGIGFALVFMKRSIILKKEIVLWRTSIASIRLCTIIRNISYRRIIVWQIFSILRIIVYAMVSWWWRLRTLPSAIISAGWFKVRFDCAFSIFWFKVMALLQLMPEPNDILVSIKRLSHHSNNYNEVAGWLPKHFSCPAGGGTVLRWTWFGLVVLGEYQLVLHIRGMPLIHA